VTFQADGTYQTDSGIMGTWTLNGSELCVVRSTGESNCMEVPADTQPGATWQSEDAAGNPVTVTVEAVVQTQ
jgi:hypothetical protein